MIMPRKFDDAQRKAMCDAYLDGEKVVAIAKAFDTSSSTVGSILDRVGIRRRHKNNKRSKIIALRMDEGLSQDQIVERLNASRNYVRHIFAEADLRSVKPGSAVFPDRHHDRVAVGAD